MKRYPAYKDSGVEWIGSIPEHWDMKRIKYLFNEINERSEIGDETLLSVSEYYGVAPRSEVISDGDHLTRAESLIGYKKCQVGDIVMNIMLAWKRALGCSKWDGIVSPSYAVYRSNGEYVNSWFYHYLFRTNLYVSEFSRNSTGIIDSRLRLYPEEFLNIFTIKPLPEDQNKISKYLDHKIPLIDTLIEKKQKQIELLQEQRVAIINQAVTKGLNPKVKMKNSRIEWLGGVPENWKRIQLKRVFSQIDYGISDSLSGDGDIKVLTMGNIQNGAVVIPEDGCINEVDPQLLLRQFDLLFNRTNSRDLVAKVGIYKNNIDEKVTFASYLVRFRTNGNNDSEYMNYLLNSNDFITYARSLALHSINQSNLNSTKYSQIVVYLPPKEEQIEITQYLENRCIVIEEMIQKANKKIERLKEYRTTLISEVVTGKIDVRDEAIP